MSIYTYYYTRKDGRMKHGKDEKRVKVRRQFCLSEEVVAWLEIKAAQGYSRSALVNLVILEYIEKEKGKKNAA